MQFPDESKRLRLSHNLGHGGTLTDLAGLAVLTATSFASLPGACDLAPSLDLLRRCIDREAAEYGYASGDVDDAIVNVRRAALTASILSTLDALDLSDDSAHSALQETQRLMARLGGRRG